MSIRTLLVAAVTAVLFALGSLSPAAEKPPARMEMHETTIDNLVEIAQSMAEHEAVAQRFDTEAADFDKQAARYERLAKLYRTGAGGPMGNPKNLAAHCDRIAKNFRQSAADTREMARLHRDIAHQLVK